MGEGEIDSHSSENFSIAEKYQQNNEQLVTNIPSVSNPINAFRLIKRLTNAWKELQEKMRTDRAKEYLHNITLSRQSQFPGEVSASHGHGRIQMRNGKWGAWGGGNSVPGINKLL